MFEIGVSVIGRPVWYTKCMCVHINIGHLYIYIFFNCAHLSNTSRLVNNLCQPYLLQVKIKTHNTLKVCSVKSKCVLRVDIYRAIHHW